MPSTLVTAAAAFDQQLTRHVSSQHNTFGDNSLESLLPVLGCGTIYRLSYVSTSATDNANDNFGIN